MYIYKYIYICTYIYIYIYIYICMKNRKIKNRKMVSQIIKMTRANQIVLILFRMGVGCKKAPYQFLPCFFFKRWS